VKHTRWVVSFIAMACLLATLSGCTEERRLSDEEIEEIASRVENKIWAKLSTDIHQEFALVKDEIRRMNRTTPATNTRETRPSPTTPGPEPKTPAETSPPQATPPLTS